MANIIVSPSRYIQGRGELKNIAAHLGRLGESFLFIGTESGLARVEKTIRGSFAESGAALTFAPFSGECCQSEIDRLAALAKETGAQAVVGVGGGKALDTAKAAAHYAGLNVAVVPTLASTDAPCSAISVIYSPQGVFERYLFLPANPAIVLVDSAVVAASPLRMTLSGMGDALATYFEARAAAAAGARNSAGGHCTRAALSLARLCYDTLIAEGVKAKTALEAGACTKAVEAVIEANTLLSGLGFESAGLAAAHAVHNGLTAIPATHACTHGEKVAFGTLVQLVLEDAPMEEVSEVLDFAISMDLPVTLADLGIEEITDVQLREVAALACAEGDTMGNMPFPVTPDMVYDAILAADSMGATAYVDLGFDDDCCCDEHDHEH